MRRRIAAIAIAVAAAGAFGTASAATSSAMGAGLRQLVNAFENADPRLQSQLNYHIKDATGNPMVIVHLTPGTDQSAALAKLSALGFRLTAVSVTDPSVVEGFLPLARATQAVALAAVGSVQAEHRPIRHAGSVQNQAVALEKADLAQARGATGKGIRIGAISDSYDECTDCTTHAADDVASGDLPPDVVVLQDDVPGSTDEGRAMMQLIHDLAPDAKLAFATADFGQVNLANNIIALRKTFKADIIVDDVIYGDEPMYSDGIVAQAVDLVSKDGCAYFSSAGNNGIESYEATYQPISFNAAKALAASGRSNVKLDQIPADIRPKSVHNFGDGAITTRISTDGLNELSFQWDEPFILGKVKTDYNIYVFDSAGNWMDPNSASFPGFYTTDDNTQTGEAFEDIILVPFADEIHGGSNVTDYQLVIGKVNDGNARHIKYVVINGLAPSQRQGAPSTWGHAAARGAQSVGAIYYAIPQFTEDFSSGGPVTIYFDKNGNRLFVPEIRTAPQLLAADGVDTTFFGQDTDGNGLPNFFGTSAASPDAAGVAALILQKAGGRGSLSPQALYRRMQQTATPLARPNDPSWAAALVGPVAFLAQGDWVRWNRYFNLEILPITRHSVASITFDTTPVGLTWSTNPNRFNIGVSNGVLDANITRTVSADLTKFTLAFAPKTFTPGESFSFGMSVFAPAEGSTEEWGDRFRGMKITVTMDDGSTFHSQVFAGPKDPSSNFTGSGLVNADRAVGR